MLIIPFEAIEERARERVGGAQALVSRLPVPKSPDELRATPDDRYLSLMSLRIFRAGLKHSVVDDKWGAFEEVFGGFEPRSVVAMSDEELDRLLRDTRLIRHGGKMRAVRDNAAAMLKIAEEQGGMGAYLADWPRDDVVGLWDDLGRRFSQLGGKSAPYFLRMAGRDTFVLTDAVVRGLNHWDAFEGTPKGKADRRKVQDVFNEWRRASSRHLCQISQILALSVD